MENNPRPMSLPQVVPPDHAAKILQDILSKNVVSGGASPALGASPNQTLAPDQKALREKIIAALQSIFDPEIPLNIYDLGLIYNIEISPVNAVKIQMTLTAPGCPVAGEILANVKNKITAIPEVPTTDVELVWEPPWTRDRLSEAAKLELGLM